jgi:hypothetical protein
VLEMMHASTVFGLMKKQGHNIFSSLSPQDWVIGRKVIVESILATDMTRHFELLGKFKAAYSHPPKLTTQDSRIDYFRLVLKCSDIGHAAKGTALHEQWTMLVCEEFFRQGDLEKAAGLPISMFCDRETTNVPKVAFTQSQAGFLGNLVLPLYEALNSSLASPKIAEACIDQIRFNIGAWTVKSKTRRRTFKAKHEEHPDEFQKLKLKFRSANRT